MQNEQFGCGSFVTIIVQSPTQRSAPNLKMNGRVKPRRETISKTEFLQEIAGEVRPELFWPEEAGAVLFGRLESARRAVEKVHLRALMTQAGQYWLARPQNDEGLHTPPRPVHILSRLNRSSSVFPPILMPEPITAVNLREMVDLVHHLYRLGGPLPILLDGFASCGISWSAAAILLAQTTGELMSDREVEIIAQTRLFWVLFGEARSRYSALARLNNQPRWRGDWGFFKRSELEALLPSLTLADHFERREFLANYTLKGEASVDLYTITCRPLCRHPFPAKFNPLIFGRPKLHQ